MPVTLPSFRSKEELDNWFKRTFPKANDRTYSPFFFEGLPDSDFHLFEMNKQTTRGGKGSWISRFLHDGLRNAPPLREQAWLMNQDFSGRAMISVAEEVSKEDSPLKALLARYNNYIAAGSKCEDPEVIRMY